MNPADRPVLAVIAHDADEAGRGGMERVLTDTLLRLQSSFKIVVVSCSLGQRLAGHVTHVPVRVPVRPVSVKFPAFFVRAGLATRRLQPDLILTIGAIVPNRIDMAWVHWCHAGFRDKTSSLAPVAAPLPTRLNTGFVRLMALVAERWTYRPARCRLLGAVSSPVRDELKRAYPGARVALVPDGVDLGRFRRNAHDRATVRSAYGVAEETVVALFAGGDWDRKRLGESIEAVAEVRRAGGSCVLWVLGDGDTARFGARAAAAGIEDYVVFLGYDEHPERIYSAADVLLHPSMYETFSLVAVEAAGCELPIVGTAVGVIPDLVGADEAGRIVKGDSASIASALLSLCRCPTDLLILGAAAAAHTRRFELGSAAATMATQLRSLMSPTVASQSSSPSLNGSDRSSAAGSAS